MIFLNFEFIDDDLTKNTIAYLNDDSKNHILKEAKQWDFNGIGFKNKTKLIEYLCQNGFFYKNEFMKDITSKSRRTNKETVQKLFELFIDEAPLYIDRESFYRIMLISSNLMFTPNEKIYFTLMFDNPYKLWTSAEIEKAAQNHLKNSFKNIEASLDRHTVSNKKTDSLLVSEIKDDIKYYRIHFTNLIYYIRSFEQQEV